MPRPRGRALELGRTWWLVLATGQTITRATRTRAEQAELALETLAGYTLQLLCN